MPVMPVSYKDHSNNDKIQGVQSVGALILSVLPLRVWIVTRWIKWECIVEAQPPYDSIKWETKAVFPLEYCFLVSSTACY